MSKQYILDLDPYIERKKEGYISIDITQVRKRIIFALKMTHQAAVEAGIMDAFLAMHSIRLRLRAEVMNVQVMRADVSLDVERKKIVVDFTGGGHLEEAD